MLLLQKLEIALTFKMSPSSPFKVRVRLYCFFVITSLKLTSACPSKLNNNKYYLNLN